MVCYAKSRGPLLTCLIPNLAAIEPCILHPRSWPSLPQELLPRPPASAACTLSLDGGMLGSMQLAIFGMVRVLLCVVPVLPEVEVK